MFFLTIRDRIYRNEMEVLDSILKLPSFPDIENCI